MNNFIGTDFSRSITYPKKKMSINIPSVNVIICYIYSVNKWLSIFNPRAYWTNHVNLLKLKLLDLNIDTVANSPENQCPKLGKWVLLPSLAVCLLKFCPTIAFKTEYSDPILDRSRTFDSNRDPIAPIETVFNFIGSGPSNNQVNCIHSLLFIHVNFLWT